MNGMNSSWWNLMLSLSNKAFTIFCNKVCFWTFFLYSI